MVCDRRGLLLLCSGLMVAVGALKADPVITNIALVGEQRIDRFVIQATYRANATSSSGAFTRVTATVTSGNPATTIIDGSLTFPDVPAGGSVTSTDTFTIRHDLHTPFQNSFLQFTVSATPVTANRPPTANAGPDQTVSVGATVTLNGAGSSDPDGNPLKFQWTITARPAGSTASLLNATSINPTFVADKAGSYTVTLVANDGTLNSAPDTVVISTLNSAPVANAGPNRTTVTGGTVTLDGSGSSDVDGNPLTFLWTIVSRPAGSTSALSSSTAVMPTLVADRFGTYVVQLVVNDGIASSAPDTVTVSTVNSAPVANAGPDQTARVGSTVQLTGAGSTDVDGQPLTYRWSISSAPTGSTAVLSAPTSVAPSITIDTPGTYVVQLIVNDGTANSAADTMTITTVNSPPVANAGPDQTVAVGATVTLNGSASSDVDGNPLTYTWSFTSRPAGSTATLAGASAVMPTFVADRTGQYVVQLIVNDGQVSSPPDTVVINTGNSPPIANAGPDQTVAVNRVVTLNGSGSSDVDGNPLTFTWSFVSRPAGSSATLSNPSAVMPTFTADAPGDFVVQLIVNDGTANSTPDTVRITTTNSAPTANAGPDQTVAVGASVQLNGSPSSDAEGSPLTYAWSLITRPAGSTASLTNANSATPTFTADRPGTYVAQLIVNDGFVNSAPDTVTIDTSDVPPVANAGPDQTAAVGATVTLDGSGSSDADGQPLTYAWAFTSRPTGSAAVLLNPTTVSPTFVADVAGTYVVQLIVNDGTLNSAPDTVVITTGNRPPVANAGPDRTVNVGEAAQLDGSGSSDPDSDALTYRWTIVSAPTGSTAALANATSATASLTPDLAGTYTIQLVVNDGTVNSSPDTMTVTATAAGGGTMVNGFQYTGSIDAAGEVDTWTFTASAGDRIAVHIGEVSETNDFRPWIRLQAPNGSQIGSSFNTGAAEIGDVIAPATGTYTILVASADPGTNGTGTYRLTMTHSPGPITVAAGDEGGPLTNGGVHTGTIERGDLDVWTFTATAGDRIAVHIAETSEADDFRPWMRVWAPNGASLGGSFNVAAAEIGDVIAPVTGTYLVLVASADPGVDGSGTYRLNIAKTPGPITVSPGDQGGPITIGALHTGEIVSGDIDVWTFNATAGERIAVHVGEISETNDFRPWIRVWAPNGASVGASFNVTAAEVGDMIAPVTGTYLVLVASADPGVDGAGTYRLSVVKTGSPITVSEGDQGGPLTNGGMHTGEIVRGDADVWTFNATAGDRIAVHVGETAETDDFRPWIRVWAPNGASVGASFNVTAAEVGDVIAPATGTYLVIVASADPGVDGTDSYRLSLAKTPGPITVSGGDQGGAITIGAVHTGEIVSGDVDVWTFDAAAGERIAVHVGEVTDTNDFRPWIRVWAPNGASVGASFNVAAAEVGDIIAPATGTYLVLVASADPGVDGTGTYRLSVVKTGSPITVSGGDQGGPMTNGGIHTGDITRGDVDAWTFTATAGDRLTVTIGETGETDDFRPWIRVWAPNGASVGSSFNVAAAEVGDVIAPVTGTYVVLVSTADPGVDGTGTYRLNLAKTGSSITVSAGDQGGAMTPGANHAGEIVPGDVDVWTFNAAAGQRITLAINEVTDANDFRPWIRIWGPNGASLGSSFGVSTAQIGPVTASLSGTYVVVVASADPGVDGSGTYQMTLSVVSP